MRRSWRTICEGRLGGGTANHPLARAALDGGARCDPDARAWLVIAYFFHEGIARAYDYFSSPMFELTRTSPPDWAYRWEKLRGFIGASAVLVLWIAFWAFDSRARMRATSSPQPASLEADAHARRVGLVAGDLDLWRSARIQTVDIDTTLQVVSRTSPNPMEGSPPD